MDLQTVLALPTPLPSLPRAMALLMKELAPPVPKMRRVNQLFGSDPALAARLLAQANAPAYQLQGEVAGIPQALGLVGIAQLRDLVAASPISTANRSVPGIQMQQFWRYSLNVAKIARSLAGFVRLDQSAAYSAGLLHALGEVRMHMADPEGLAKLNELLNPLDLRRASMERKVLGFTYAHVSAGLAELWGLPTILVQSLRQQLTPFEKNNAEPLAGIVHLAVWRARAQMAQFSEKQLAVTFPDSTALLLGLDIDMVLQQDPIDWMAQPNPDEDLLTDAPITSRPSGL
jgi:HD-like signal output (HDOD) protein